ncbi:MAG: family 16 glycoside hydrolase, partial [Candidatus Bathyarchaeia archaeon]
LLTSSIFDSNPVFLKMNYDGTFETIKEYSFEDEFENLRDIWVVDNGTWRIENEKLVGKTGAFGQNIMLTNRFSDFTAEYRTKWMFGEVFEQGFIFRAGSDPRTQCYIVFLSSYEDGTVRLCMRDGPHNSTLLQSAPFAPQKGKWYTVKITAKDENVQVWIDNELKINTTNNRFSSGYVGFMSWSGDEEWVLYDDLKIEYNLTHVLSSYSWEIPYSNTQNLNVLLSIDAQETNTTIPLQFYVDNEENLAYLFAKEKEFLRLGEFDLEAGNHQLVIQNNDALSSKEVILSSEFTKFFKNINPFEYGILNETICKITNGMIKTLSSYNSFDLNFKFKPGFGKETYHGPNILFAWTNNDYFRLIFHKENYLELSRNNDVLLVKDITLLADAFNDVRLIKNKETINLYLNGEHIFTFSDQRMNVEGKIGMGTEESTTIFKNITIIPAPYVAGVWSTFSGTAASVIPDFNQENPGKYSLRINQLSDSPYILCFGENYDSQWEAKVDGQVLSTHHRVNMYANGWILNTTAGIHEIEIYYKPNDTYFLLLYFSIASLIALSVLSYLPEKVLKRIVFPKRKRERILQNINPGL